MKQLIACLLLLIIIGGCSKKGNDDTDYNPPAPALKPDTIPSNWMKTQVCPSVASDVYFTNNQVGWLTGSDGIYRSTNGGVSWNKISTISTSYNIAAFGTNKALFVAGTNYVNYTNDAGATFQQSAVPLMNYFDCFYSSANVVYLNASDRIMKSTDGGATFPLSFLINDGSISGALYFTDDLHGWATRASGLYSTADGGVSWSLLNAIPYPNYSYGVQFLDATTGWYLIQNNNASLFRTTNAGASFTNNYVFPATGAIADLHFFNANDGFVSTGNWLYKTVDGGNSFTQVIGLGNAFIIEIHFTDMSHGWISCSDGTVLRLM